jgi:CHASE3 domain sensor protein
MKRRAPPGDSDSPVTQRELTAAVQSAQLSTQLAEVIKDLSELRTETRVWQDRHTRDHSEAERARQAGRRWLITTGIAAAVGIAGLYPLMIALAHLH